MAFRWTRIHALLGDEPAELSYDQITRAIAGHLAETDDLDWKTAWPDPSEFRKDVAAMANSGGGLIVCGIAEAGDGRAELEEPIAWSDPEERRLRAIASSGIHPPVFGLAFKAFESAARAGFVVALSVPASEEAPHLVMPDRHNFSAPYRDGAATQYMNERTLERAYAGRLQRRGDLHRSLTDDLDGARDVIDLESNAWLIAVSHPVRPTGSARGALRREEVTGVLEDALVLAKEICPAAGSPLLWNLGNAANNPRPGLRRWVVETLSGTPDDLADSIRVELRHDGSLLLAASTEGWYDRVLEDKDQVPVAVVEAFATDLVALSSAVSRRSGDDTPRAHRLDIARKDSSRLIGVLDNRTVGGMTLAKWEQPSWSRSVRRFIPVSGATPGALDVVGMRAVAAEIALDVLNQFGVFRLSRIPTDG